MADVFRNLDWTVITGALLRIIPALLCITFHELSHGLVAYKLGDPTAKKMGRLTLNPLKHIDPMGLLSMIIFRIGWAKPVPVDMRYFRHPKRDMAITAIAGPLSNLLLAAVVLFLYGLTYRTLEVSKIGVYLLEIIYMTAYLSVVLAVFNAVPIPPLDGSKVLFSVLSNENYWKLMRYERYGMLVLILLVVSGVTGNYLSSAMDFVFEKLFAIAQLMFDLTGV